MSETSKPLKIVVTGDGGVGKTSLLVTYMAKEFPENYEEIIKFGA